ncbi:MAG: DUF2213 domain-containing protein [Myxococcota bacterium]
MGPSTERPVTRRERRKRKLNHERRTRLERRTDAADPTEAPKGSTPAWHYREDAGTLLKPQRRGNELFIEGMAAKAGILTYKNADGTETRELVTFEVLRDSAEGLGRAPVTLEHPDDDVDPDNWQQLAVGDVGDRVKVHEDTGYVQVQLAVRRSDAMTAIESGEKQELSPGYHAQIDATPGVHPEFGAYDAIQTHRRYNHLAIVSDARGGRSIRLRTDSATSARAVDVISSPSRPSPPPTPSKSPGAPMRLSPWMIALCTRAGLDHRRYDSDEEAGKAVDAKLAETNDMAPPQPPAQSQDTAPPVVHDMSPTDDNDESTDDDEHSGYTDENGERLTKDQYIERLESMVHDMYEQQAKSDMEPLAKDMGVEIKKGDSAQDIAVKIAEVVVGRVLTEQQRADASYVAAMVDVAEARRQDSADSGPGTGRAAGLAAWGDLLPAPAPEARHDASDPSSFFSGGLGQASLNAWNDAFEASRGGAQ